MTAAVVMGVAGCGKTRVGTALADRLGWTFVDGDDHHPPANVAKMGAGVPLTDADRAPWLAELNEVIRAHQARGQDLVLACSALTRTYRSRLGEDVKDLRIAFLDITPEVAAKRLQDRQGHFMPPDLLASQFATLERPDADEDPGTEILTVDVDRPVEAIVDDLATALRG